MVMLITLLPGLASAVVTQSVLTASLLGPSSAAGGLTGFDLWIETTTIEPAVGVTSPLAFGGLTIAFDPNVLDFEEFVFAPNVKGSNTAVEDSDLCTSTLSGCVSGIVISPGTPPYETEVAGGLYFGTFFFNYLGGSSLLELGPDDGPPFSFSLGTATYEYEGKKFGGASVVPLPLAAWLMLSGLGMLGALGFRKSS